MNFFFIIKNSLATSYDETTTFHKKIFFCEFCAKIDVWNSWEYLFNYENKYEYYIKLQRVVCSFIEFALNAWLLWNIVDLKQWIPLAH